MTATPLDGKATLATIKAELSVRVAAPARAGGRPRARHRARRRRPGQPLVRRRQAQGLRRDRHRQHRAATCRPRPPRPRSRPSSTSSTPTRPAPAFLVQQPTGLDEFAILSRVDPVKDVDGLHPTNLGWLVLGKPAPLPCTPMGSSSCCAATTCRSPAPRSSSSAAASPWAGRSGCMLTRRSENATVTLCHTGTRDLAAEVRRADIVVAAAGVPGHRHRRHGQARRRGARRRREPGQAPTASGSPATSPPTWPRWPAGSPPTPAGSGR